MADGGHNILPQPGGLASARRRVTETLFTRSTTPSMSQVNLPGDALTRAEEDAQQVTAAHDPDQLAVGVHHGQPHRCWLFVSHAAGSVASGWIVMAGRSSACAPRGLGASCCRRASGGGRPTRAGHPLALVPHGEQVWPWALHRLGRAPEPLRPLPEQVEVAGVPGVGGGGAGLRRADSPPWRTSHRRCAYLLEPAISPAGPVTRVGMSAKRFPADDLAKARDRHDTGDPPVADDDGCQVPGERRPTEQGRGRILGAGHIGGRDRGDDLLQRGDASAGRRDPGQSPDPGDPGQ